MKRKIVCLFLCVFSLLLILPGMPASANSGEPPCFTIIVENAPQDLTLAMEYSSGEKSDPYDVRVMEKGWETYYHFMYPFPPNAQWTAEWADSVFVGATVLVSTGGETLRLSLPLETYQRYNNILTLDLKTGTLEVGQRPWRAPLLIALRVVLTLLIEGLVFLLFGYREKRSWLVFLLVNLVTQAGLNILVSMQLAEMTYLGGVYWALLYIPMELVIFIVEMAAFACLIKEHRKRRAVLYAFIANAASLLLGGLIISYLPV